MKKQLFAAVIAAGAFLGACTLSDPSSPPWASSSSAEVGSVKAAPPCDHAELHSTSTRSECRDGHLAEIEHDLWCCMDDNTQRETDTVISVSDNTCNETDVDAGSLPVCTVAASFNPVDNTSGLVQDTISPTPGTCTVTIAVTAKTSGTWTAVNNGTSDVTLKASGVTGAGSVTYDWTCTCPQGVGVSSKGSQTITIN